MKHLLVIVIALAISGCFLRVTSGVVHGVPAGAAAKAQALAPGEDVVVGWDGSFAQDGSVLVLVTRERLLFFDADKDKTEQLALVDITTIVVDEDDGRVLVKSVGSSLSLPLTMSSERLSFAQALQRAVQERKQVPVEP